MARSPTYASYKSGRRDQSVRQIAPLKRGADLSTSTDPPRDSVQTGERGHSARGRAMRNGGDATAGGADIAAGNTMIIFGWRSKVVPGVQVVGASCPCCGGTTHHGFGAFRYFHLYWIPTVPFGKKVGLQCAHCRHERWLDARQEPAAHKQLRAELFPARRVARYFAGAYILAGLAVFGAVAGQMNHPAPSIYASHGD
jgi:hypothetical protein